MLAWRGYPRPRLPDLLLDSHLHHLPPPLMVLALRFELWIAAGMKGVFGDGEAQARANKHVGSPVVTRHKASKGHREGGAITQHPRPRLGIFVGNHRGHCPSKHGVAAGERSVDHVMFEEVAVIVSLIGPLARE